MALPKYSKSVDGYEMQFMTNYLGHFLLTKLLMPNLLDNKNGTRSRVINVSSIAHIFCKNVETQIDNGLKNNNGPLSKIYSPYPAYGFSKACQILHARELTK
eukprot:817693_1